MGQAIRDYDGTGDYTDHEVIDLTGAFTLVAVIERDGDGTWDAIATHQTSGDAFRVSMALSNGNRLQLATHNGSASFAGISSSGSNPFTVTASDSWCIVVVRKAAGTTTCTLSKYTTGGGWVHTVSAGGIQNPATQSGGKVRLGRYENTDDLNGKIAAYAVWAGASLSDTDVELLDGGDRQAWKSVAGGYTDLIEPAVAPDGTIAASWATNVASENGLLDQTGNGGNGTIGTGDLPPSGVYTLGVTAGDTPPSNTVAPAITGTLELGETLTVSDGTWDGSPSPTFTYQWYLASSDVGDGAWPGGEGFFYESTGDGTNELLLEAEHVGGYPFCAVTATNGEPPDEAALAPDIGVVVDPDAPVNTVAPVASGTPTEGETLTVTDGTWTGDPTPTFAYQWQADDGGGFAFITGETSATCTLTSGEVGSDIRCRVRGTNTQGFADAYSNTLGPVAAADAAAPNCYRMTAGGLVAVVGRRMTASGLFPPVS